MNGHNVRVSSLIIERHHHMMLNLYLKELNF